MAGNDPAKPRGAKRGRASPVDVHVGRRVRMRRTMLGMSQEKLGDSLGLTFQQVQKYERGTNRIGASRLFDLCKVLDVPVGFFFDDMGAEGARAAGFAEERSGIQGDPMARRETLQLVRAYYRITDPRVRRKVFDLAKTLARSADESA
ncbi:MAG: helix-turn-helix domain-containing protein [Alphaproteobacteria bacterium]